MHALVVVAHSDPQSLTQSLARQLAQSIVGTGHTAEIADLAAEGFDPCFGPADLAHFRRTASAPADVAAEQARLDRADALVIVYPIYWWSFPALLKGWIDRVFTQGWAFDEQPDGRIVKLLQRLPVHLVASGGADQRTMARHGYFGAMKTQIDHGIFGYCGAPVLTTELLLVSDAGFPDAHLDTVAALGRKVFASRS